MDAHVGTDCQIALDGMGYWLEPGTYQVHRPRLRKAKVTANGGEIYVDSGPGRRVWSFTVLARNNLARYDGQPTGIDGQLYRDTLLSAYDKRAPLSLIDPHGECWVVHFDLLTESLPDLRSALSTPSYLLHVELVEASNDATPT